MYQLERRIDIQAETFPPDQNDNMNLRIRPIDLYRLKLKDIEPNCISSRSRSLTP